MASRKTRGVADDLRATSKLLVEATTGVMGVVEAMHTRIAAGPEALGRPLKRPVNAVTGVVYGSIRGVTRAVGQAIDSVLTQLEPVLGDHVAGRERLAVLSALNGVVGDRLEESGSPLALAMEFCHQGEPLVLDRTSLRESLGEVSPHVVVLVHGSSMNDLQWARHGHDHGVLLAAHLGATTLRLRYNSGLHISLNGARLSALLETLLKHWPVPMKRLTIVAHSMGGLVTRSSCAEAARAGHQWLGLLESLVFLGTPHHGAPLERGGNWLHTALGVSSYSAPLAVLARIRSAGVTDLRYGFVLDEHWRGVDRFAAHGDRRTPVPLPVGVRCYAIAGSLSAKETSTPRSDGLVPVKSALGITKRSDLCLDFAPANCLTVFGASHLDLLDSPVVGEALTRWLTPS